MKHDDPSPPLEATNPEIGLGDVWKYSAVIAKVIAALRSAETIPAGGEADFEPFTTWLPDGHEWELTLHGKKKR